MKGPGGRRRGKSKGGSASLYPSDHFEYATKLTEQSAFNTFIKENVDGGKTVFLRTIASDG